jgi:diguanylate cyclase (GGDEF)-like protein
VGKPVLERLTRKPRAASALPPGASAFLALVALATAGIVATTGGPAMSRTLVTAAVASAAAQLFVVITPKNQSYHISMPFLVAAAIVLPVAALPLVAVVQHAPEWLKVRYAWYIQVFNICNYALSLSAGAAAANAVGGSFAARGAVAAVVIVLANHLLLATMLRLARGHSFASTGLFSAAGLTTDGALAAAGVTIAYVWQADPLLALVAAVPLVLFHRSLVVPQLAAEARADPKTGLYNSRHFAQAVEDHLARAARSGRPVALVMADLDFLRDINNSYGHLVGDAVLVGVADVFRRELRPHDVATRFGGEEFAILLPDTDADEATAVAERVRAAVEGERYGSQQRAVTVSATVSLGVAAFPEDATVAVDLIHKADMAAYAAKERGRNRVVAWRDVTGASDVRAA